MRLVVFLICLFSAWPTPACWISPPIRAVMVSGQNELHGVAPKVPSVSYEIRRGDGTRPLDSCSDTGVLILEMPLEGENASLAYEFKVTSKGSSRAIIVDGIYRGYELAREGKLQFPFSWVDGADVIQEPIEISVQITPYRLTGETGDPVVLQIADRIQ